MAQENWHIIQRQRIEVLVPRRYNALAVQQRLDRLMSEQVLPRLEPVFDRRAGPETWIEFGRLEVDAVRLPPNAPDAVWGERLFQACVQTLEHQLEQKSGEAPVSGAQSVLEALAVFLEQGRLPWWAPGLDLEAALLEEIPRQPRAILDLLGTERARQRWVRQFAAPTQHLLLEAIAPGALPLTLNQWERLAGDELPGPQARHLYWETLWEALRNNGDLSGKWTDTLIRRTATALGNAEALGALVRRIRLSRQLPAALKTQWQALLQSRQSIDPETWAALTALSPEETRHLYEAAEQQAVSPDGADWLELLIHLTAARLSTPEALQQFRQNIRRNKQLSSTLQGRMLDLLEQFDRGNVNKPVVPQKPKEQGDYPITNHPLTGAENPYKKLLAEAEDAGIYIPLAGIVLIHPFLPAFFERLGLLDGGQWRDDDARERAVHLLYFLATGLQHPREDELVLLKLLAGMAPDQPIARELDLSDTEKNEAQHLLEAVIDAWDALESSNPDDLRGSFLVREGKLQRGDLGWKLTVEQKAWDILLSQLPWGISPILHSWMGEMIWVDWG